MKRIFNFLSVLAVMSLSIVSCQKEINNTVDLKSIDVVVKAHAQDIQLPDVTKTYIDESASNTIFWGKDEFMTLAVIDAQGAAKFAKSNSSSKDLWEGESEAMFEFSLSNVAESDSYTYCGVYPASAVIDGNNPKAMKVDLPASQLATASSYAPGAYIMIAKPEVFNELETEWEASYRRATALNKITLKNISEDIVKVEITAEGKDLAGRRYFDITEDVPGEIYYANSATVEVNYTTALTGTDKVVWFTSWDVELAENDPLTVVAYSSTTKYTRTINAKASGIKFQEGFLNTLSINMADAETESLSTTDLSGEYIIIGTDDENGYYAMQNYVSGNNCKGVAVSYNDGVVSSMTDLSSCKMTIAAVNGKSGYYTIKDTGAKYLYAASSSGNQMKGEASVDSNNNAYWHITSEDGAFSVKADLSSNRNVMQYNYNSGTPLFNCYSSASQKPVILVSWDKVSVKTLKSIAVSGTPTKLTYTDGDSFDPAGLVVTGTYSDDSQEEITDGIDWTFNPNPLTEGTTSCVVTASVGTIKSDAYTVSELTVTAASTGGTAKYVKVTSTANLTNGTYLIVCEDQNVAFNGALTTLDAVSNTVAVTISNGEIAKSDAVDSATFTFTASDGSFKGTGDKYFGNASDSNGLTSSDTALSNTVSITDGDADIVGAGGAYLRYNATSGQTRFRYYKSSTYTAQKTIQLYKLTN